MLMMPHTRAKRAYNFNARTRVPPGCRRSLLAVLWAAAAMTAEVPAVSAAAGSGENLSTFDLPGLEQAMHSPGYADSTSHLHGDQHPLMSISLRADALVYRYSLDDKLKCVEVTAWIRGGVVGFEYLVEVQDVSGKSHSAWQSVVQVSHHHDCSRMTCSFPVTAVFATDPEALDSHRFLVRIWDDDPDESGEMTLLAAMDAGVKGKAATIAYEASPVEHGRGDLSTRGLRMSGPRFMDMSMRAVNWARQERLYFHDSLLERMPLVPRRVDPRFITEHTGLKVPTEYDCAPAFTRNRFQRAFDSDPYWTSPEMIDVLGINYATYAAETDGRDSGGFTTFDYYRTVPSRWVACHNHQAHIRSGQTWMLPTYPIVDEEYVEMVAVYEMALNARGSFSIVEVGARWGTWGYRAAAAVRAYNPAVSQVNLFFVEPDGESCEAIHAMARINEFVPPRYNVSVNCQAVDRHSIASVNASLRAWAAGMTKIDVLDLDCQGCEFVLVPAILDLIEAKVHRVILGVHADDYQPHVQALRSSFAHWRCVHEANNLGGKGEFCQKTLWEPYKWPAQQAVEERCSLAAFDHGYAYGPMINYDGALLADNPIFDVPVANQSDTAQHGCWRRQGLAGDMRGEPGQTQMEPPVSSLPPSSPRCEIDFSESDWDPVQRMVNYPWRISIHRRFDSGFVVRQVVSLGVDGQRHPQTVCLIPVWPGDVENANWTTKCDLHFLKDAGVIQYGVYLSQVFLHECDIESCLNVIDGKTAHGEGVLTQAEPDLLKVKLYDLGSILCESSVANVSINVPPKTLVSSPHSAVTSFTMPPWVSRQEDRAGVAPSCLPSIITEKRAGGSSLQADEADTRGEPLTNQRQQDQIIRISNFHGRLGNVLIQLGVAFVVAHKLGANVIQIPLNQALRSSVGGFLGTAEDGVDPTDPGGEDLRYFFPGLSERIRLPVKSSGRWKGEIDIGDALDFVLKDEAIAPWADGLNVTVDSETTAGATDDLFFLKQNLLHPFGHGFGRPFSNISWIPSVVQRMFQMVLLPTLRGMPELSTCRVGGRQAECRDTEDDLVVHFRSGDIYSYRSSFHNFIRKHLYQPPLAFYIKAIETHLRRFPHAKIVLVAQIGAVQQNPCVQPILHMYSQARLSRLELAFESFTKLVGAKHLVLSRSSFSLMASLMAPDLVSLYSPDLPPARWWPHASFDHFEFSFPGFHMQLRETLSSDWRLDDDALPLDFDARLTDPTLNYDPDLVLCEHLSNDSAVSAGH